MTAEKVGLCRQIRAPQSLSSRKLKRPHSAVLLASTAGSGQGKRGGFRTLVVANKGNRWIFVFGFPKNERSNIDKDEEIALKHLAAHLLSLMKHGIDTALAAGELMEIDCDAQNQISDT